jgi:hypothetical protein
VGSQTIVERVWLRTEYGAALPSGCGVVPFHKPERRSAFDGQGDWLRERFFRHDGNADVITILGDSYRLREKRRSGLLQKAGSALDTAEISAQ